MVRLSEMLWCCILVLRGVESCPFWILIIIIINRIIILHLPNTLTFINSYLLYLPLMNDINLKLG